MSRIRDMIENSRLAAFSAVANAARIEASGSSVDIDCSGSTKVVLDSTQNMYGRLVLTDLVGNLSAPVVVELDNNQRAVAIQNDTTQDVTITTPNGGNVVVKPGTSNSLYVAPSSVVSTTPKSNIVECTEDGYRALVPDPDITYLITSPTNLIYKGSILMSTDLYQLSNNRFLTANTVLYSGIDFPSNTDVEIIFSGGGGSGTSASYSASTGGGAGASTSIFINLPSNSSIAIGAIGGAGVYASGAARAGGSTTVNGITVAGGSASNYLGSGVAKPVSFVDGNVYTDGTNVGGQYGGEASCWANGGNAGTNHGLLGSGGGGGIGAGYPGNGGAGFAFIRW